MKTFIAKALIIYAAVFAASNSWAFDSQEGSFSAAFPVNPEITNKVTSRGTERWHTARNAGHSFVVVYYAPAADVKSLSTKQIMDAEEQGLSGGAPVVRKKDFAIGGNPARELETKSGDGLLILARIIITKERVFEVLSVSKAPSPTPQQRAFVTSFTLAR